jgi:hypothetical protein
MANDPAMMPSVITEHVYDHCASEIPIANDGGTSSVS